MKRILSVVLALVLVAALIPAGAFADEPVREAGSFNSVSTTASAPNVQVPEDERTGKPSVESTATVQKTSPLAASATAPYGFTIKQTTMNYTDITVTFDDLSNLKKTVDSVEAVLTMTYMGTLTQSASKTQKLSSLSSDSFTMKAPTYGTFDVELIFTKNGKKITSETTTINVNAEEYNIAPIVATFPVVFFSLSLPQITTNAEGDPIPTFVSLQRPDAYNWDKLPENVYWQPNLTKAQVEKQTSFDTKTTKFSDYVRMLYQNNPQAKFNLYVNDAYPKYMLRLLCANGIPEDQFTLTLLTDGSGTYSHFNSVFAGTDAQTKYDAMKAGPNWHFRECAE